MPFRETPCHVSALRILTVPAVDLSPFRPCYESVTEDDSRLTHGPDERSLYLSSPAASRAGRIVRPHERGQVNMSKSMAITRKGIDDEVNLLKALGAQYAEKKGSAAERKANATVEALDQPVDITDSENPIPAFPMPEADQPLRLGDLAVYVHSLDQWAEQVANEAVTAILKAQGDDTSLDAIKAQFDEKRTFVEALLKVAPAFGVSVDDVELPTLRAGRSSASRPTSRRKGKFGHYYRVVSGVRHDQPASQDTLSSFAWYQGHNILGGDRPRNSVKADELTKWLSEHGVDSPMGKAWEVEGADGNTYGMEIVDNSATDQDEEE